MRDVSDAVLLAYLVGASEPPLTRELERLLSDPEIDSRLHQLRERLERASVTPSPWRIPPPGIAGGRAPFVAVFQAAAVMSGDAVQPGDRVEVRLVGVTEPDDRRVVVLQQAPTGWEVVFPTRPGESLGVSELPVSEGGYRLDLVARRHPGRQRWAIALPRTDSTPDDLQALRDGIRDGETPVYAVEFQVAA